MAYVNGDHKVYVAPGLESLNNPQVVMNAGYENAILSPGSDIWNPFGSEATSILASRQQAQEIKPWKDMFSDLLEMDYANSMAQFNREASLSREIAEFNASEAAKQRTWQSEENKTAYTNSLALQDDAQEWASTETDDNQTWLKEMSDTAYQRATDDLLKAGLHPAMAVGAQASTPASSVTGAGTNGVPVGSGASAHSAPMASSSKADLSSLFGSIGSLYSSLAGVSASIENTKTMSKSMKYSANMSLLGGIFGSISRVVGSLVGGSHNTYNYY